MEHLVYGKGLSVDDAIYHVQRTRGIIGNRKRKCEAALKAAHDLIMLEKFFDENIATEE